MINGIVMAISLIMATIYKIKGDNNFCNQYLMLAILNSILFIK